MRIIKSGAQDLYNTLYWQLGHFRLSTSFTRMSNTGLDRFRINLAVNRISDELIASWCASPTLKELLPTLPEKVI